MRKSFIVVLKSCALVLWCFAVKVKIQNMYIAVFYSCNIPPLVSIGILAILCLQVYKLLQIIIKNYSYFF